MLDSKTDRHNAVTRKLTLPDIEPEDLNRPPRVQSGKARPIRSSEIKSETVEVA